MSKRMQSAREELANCGVHGAALFAAIAAIPLLFAFAAGDSARPNAVAGCIAFAATMVLLYLCSTLYHALPEGRARSIMLRLDHGAIYLFIAGSFTPFATIALDQTAAHTQLALVWLIAVAGFILKACGRLQHPLVSTGSYLLMGWAVLATAAPMLAQLPSGGVRWLIVGGAAYSVGVIFFTIDSRLRYAHAIWHGFVVAGTTCHFVAILAAQASLA